MCVLLLLDTAGGCSLESAHCRNFLSFSGELKSSITAMRLVHIGQGIGQG